MASGGRRSAVSAAVVFVGGVLALFLVWPLAEAVRGALVDPRGRLTIAYVAAVLDNPVYVTGFEHALAIAVATTLVSVVIGTGLATVLAGYDFPGKRWLRGLVPLPLMLPPFVGAIGIRQLFGREGVWNAFLGALHLLPGGQRVDWLRDGRFAVVVALTALHLFPVVYLNVQAALTRRDADLEDAARGLGCHGLGLFWKITLPSILPGLFAAASIVLIWSFTELGVPLMCDYTRVTSVQIFSGLKDIGRNPFVYALVVIVLAATTALYGTIRMVLGRVGTTGRAGRSPRPYMPRRPSPMAAAAMTVAVTAVVGVAALPNIAVVLLAFARDWYGTILPSGLTIEHFRAAVGHDLVVTSIGNSLRYVTLSTGADLAVGTVIAWLAVRARAPGARVVDALAMLPLAVPGLVMAFGYFAIAREGRPLAFLNPVKNPTALLVIAYTIRRLPFVIRSASAGFAQVSVTLEEAAASVGAGRLATFARITLPLITPQLLAGGVLAFALSMLEVSDSLVLAQRQATYPITKTVYELFQLLGEGRQMAAALGVWAMLFLVTVVWFVTAALRGRLDGVFRGDVNDDSR